MVLDYMGRSGDVEFGDLCAVVAYEVANATPKVQVEPHDLRNGFAHALGAVQLYRLGKWFDTTGSEEESSILKQVTAAVARNAEQRAASQNATPSVQSFAQAFKKDPSSRFNQATIKEVRQCISAADILSADALRSERDNQKRAFTETCELEEYSGSVNKVLYDTFHSRKHLPCTCSTTSGERQDLCLVDDFDCALRLNGHRSVTGNDEHCFFDSIIAKQEKNDGWTPVQFRLPRKFEDVKVRVESDAAEPDPGGRAFDQVPGFTSLADFCAIMGWGIRSFRVHVARNAKNGPFHASTGPFSRDFPRCGEPQSLSTAMLQDNISPKSRVFIAFALSKAFWQYYDSAWMNVEWNLDTIQLLRTKSLESNAPFLRIRSSTNDAADHRACQSKEMRREPGYVHRYPYILNLGLLLTQLGSKPSDAQNVRSYAGGSLGIIESNKLCMDCCWTVADTEWPAAQYSTKAKSTFRAVVEECLPLNGKFPPLLDTHLDAEGRRLTLKERVVRPLFRLLQEMSDSDDVLYRQQKPAREEAQAVLQSDAATVKSEGQLASEWMDRITQSWLHKYVDEELKHKKRPKIAIIDTGFDDGARFVDGCLKQRLNIRKTTEPPTDRWNDYLGSGITPVDEDGHGTAMLSIIYRLAPFAEFCIARIAKDDNDLRARSEVTSENLAKAIRWAVEKQHADIISISLGWEQEQCLHQRRTISNAIGIALGDGNQDVLIFAAASNHGGTTHELFPANHPLVISVRGANLKGQHQDFNPSLPKGGDKVFGALGVAVPARRRGKTTPNYYVERGTSAATAIMAGLAALVIGYINASDAQRRWDNVRMHKGFRNLLMDLSTEQEERKLFFSLDDYSASERRTDLEAALTSASRFCR